VTRAEQNQAIEGILDYLRLVNRHFDGSTKTIRSLMLDYGVRCYMNRATFAGPRATPQQCYRNAFKLASKGLVYVEGWCHMGLIPIEHAWCIDQKGHVIDPTLNKAAGYFVLRTALKTKVAGVIGPWNPELLDTSPAVFLHPTKPTKKRRTP
jgi:hypothetical protein